MYFLLKCEEGSGRHRALKCGANCSLLGDKLVTSFTSPLTSESVFCRPLKEDPLCLSTQYCLSQCIKGQMPKGHFMGISAALAVVLYLTPVNENVLIYDLRTGRKKKKK